MATGAYRLPTHVIPMAYAIDLETTPRRKTFGGRLEASVRVASATDTVELNARDLKIADVRAKVKGKTVKGKVTLRPDRETAELTFAKPLPRGRAVLTMSFKGKLNERMAGLYLARSGSAKSVVSQCEAAEARAIFPCWDEPSFKATLEWTVRTDPGLVVVTNGVPLSARKHAKSGLVVHKFKKTKVLPTYLAAITVGPYEAAKTQRVLRIPCTSWSMKGQTEQTKFADEVTAFVLPWFTEYFEQKYHYAKLDQVAVPGFDAGAMENAGAVFYRQQLYLMDPASASWSTAKEIAEVIAHEIAHQWFGNRVTMVWWDDLWLNEAFATWISHKAVNAWRPQWRIWDEFLGGRREALSRDALHTTHPIYNPVGSPAEATEMFDAITYFKGCCVLRQLEEFLGAGAFRDGLRDYIDRFKDGNARGADLWAALGRASGQPVDALARSWTQQGGFPLVKFERVAPDRLRVSQKRFFSNATAMTQPNDQTWHVPLQLVTSSGQVIPVLMTSRTEEVEIPADAEWIFPNREAIGFYRSQLDDELRATLEVSALSAAERQSFLEDQWALVVAGEADIRDFLDAVGRFRGEKDYAVLRSLASRLSYLDQYLVTDDQREALQAFVRDLLGAAFDEIGWDPADDEEKSVAVARAELASILGDIARDPAVLSRAEKLADLELGDAESLEPNLAGVVVRLSALRGKPSRFDRYVDEYLQRVKENRTPELQARYLHSLPAFESSTLVGRLLELCIDGTVPQEQLVSVYGSLLLRRPSQLKTWKFLKKNWRQIEGRIGLMGVGRLVEYPAALPLELRDDVEKFFEKNPVDQARRALAQALEALDNRAELTKRTREALAQWLRAWRASNAA